MNGLADLILVVHFGFMLFIVGGFALILAGAMLSWDWVRNRTFRLLHLTAIVLVAAESIAGVACPLTVWEDALRQTASARSFVGRWLSRWLYYDFPEWSFTLAYVAFAIAVAITWWWLPPRRGKRA